MYESSINYLVVFVGTIAHYMLGALWYSPVLFSKAWIGAVVWSDEEVKDIKEKGGNEKGLALQLLGTLVLVFVTAYMVDFIKVVYPELGALQVGMTSAFWLWLGYIATFGLIGIVFEQYSWKL